MNILRNFNIFFGEDKIIEKSSRFSHFLRFVAKIVNIFSENCFREVRREVRKVGVRTKYVLIWSQKNIIDCSIDHGFEPVLDASEDRGARRVRAVQVDDGVRAAVAEAEAKFLGYTYWN